MTTHQEKLRSFATKHLLYEVEMLQGLVDRLLAVLEHDEEAGHRDLAWLDLATRNAQVESFAIHTRGLLDFLYEPGTVKDDDALARHYFPGGWDPPELPSSLSVVRRRVGKEIAHLTYGRTLVSDEARKWTYALIWADMSAILREFVSNASPELLPKSVARQIEQLTAAPSPNLPNVVNDAASATHSASSLRP